MFYQLQALLRALIFGVFLYLIPQSSAPPASRAGGESQPSDKVIHERGFLLGATYYLAVLSFVSINSLFEILFALSYAFSVDIASVLPALIEADAYNPALSSQTLLGFTIFITGAWVRTRAFRELGRLFTGRLHIRQGHRVVQTGPYRFMRHPSYTGAMMMQLGLALLSGGGGALECWAPAWVRERARGWLWWLCLVGYLVPWMATRTVREERMMTEQFGNEYREYCARTARFIPYIW